MIPRMPWFDRQFTLDLPVAVFPSVVERLRGTPVRLETRLLTVTKENLSRRDNDSWSIQENAGHLTDLEPLWLARVNDILKKKTYLREADLSNRATHEAGHNRAALADILNGFSKTRLKLVALLDTLEEAALRLSAKHPRLETSMRIIDLAFFVAEHDDHHLARITELLKAGSVE